MFNAIRQNGAVMFARTFCGRPSERYLQNFHIYVSMQLLSLSHLHCWHINPQASCLLCRSKICTTTHVLGTCTVAPQHACSIFHHDSVLSVLVVALKSFFSSNKCNNAQSNNSIKFLKAGGKSSKYTKKLHPGLLYLTADWNLLSNLDDKEVSDLLLL